VGVRRYGYGKEGKQETLGRPSASCMKKVPSASIHVIGHFYLIYADTITDFRKGGRFPSQIGQLSERGVGKNQTSLPPMSLAVCFKGRPLQTMRSRKENRTPKKTNEHGSKLLVKK